MASRRVISPLLLQSNFSDLGGGTEPTEDPDESYSDTTLLEDRCRAPNYPNNRKTVEILKDKDKYPKLR